MAARTAVRAGRRWLIATAMLVTMVAAHGEVVVQDDRGVVLRFAAPPRRVVSLAPSFTESVCALGACDRLVGTDRFSDWPARVLALPKLGGLDDAPLERIVALKPDLVIASVSARGLERLARLGVPVLALQTRDHADVQRTLQLLGRLLGRTGDAQRVQANIELAIRAAADRVPPVLRGRKVYFEIDRTPYAAGASSFIGETLGRLGLGNVVPPSLGSFPRLNPEVVVGWQPDLVMTDRASLAEMRWRPGWSSLRALRDGQQCGFDAPQQALLTRPGPRLGEAAALLAECLASLPAVRGRSDPGSLAAMLPVR